MNPSGQLLAALLGTAVRLAASDKPALNFKEAIATHRERTAIPPEEFYKLEARARRQAFTIANVAQLDTVVQVHKSIDGALASGAAYDKWAKEAVPELESAWNGTVANPGWRTETIFRNAVQIANNTGRYVQATTPEALEARPYWIYDGIRDLRECPICASCNGVILPADHPWWQTHLAPLHHCCRCGFRTLTTAEAEKLGISTEEKVKTAQDADEGFGGVPGTSDWTEKAYDERREVAPEETRLAERKQSVEDAAAESRQPPAPPSEPPAGGGGGDEGNEGPPWPPKENTPGGSMDTSARQPESKREKQKLDAEIEQAQVLVDQGARVVFLPDAPGADRIADVLMFWPPDKDEGAPVELKGFDKAVVTALDVQRAVRDSQRSRGNPDRGAQAPNVLVYAAGKGLTAQDARRAFKLLWRNLHSKRTVKYIRVVLDDGTVEDSEAFW